MYVEEFIEAFEDNWSIVQKDTFCIAVGMPMIVLLCEDEKTGKDFMEKHTVLPEDIMILVNDENGNIAKVLYDRQKKIDPEYDFKTIASYLSYVRGLVYLADIDSYVIPEMENDECIPFQRIGTNQINRILEELEEVDEHAGMVLRNGGWRENKLWYRVDDETDADEFYKKTVLFGIFGWHKFAKKEYIQGFLYFLTCGFCGIAVLIDLIMMLTGRYSYKKTEYSKASTIKRSVEKLYIKKPTIKKTYAIGGMVLTMALALIMELCIVPAITGCISSVTSNAIKQTAENNPDKFENIVDFIINQ